MTSRWHRESSIAAKAFPTPHRLPSNKRRPRHDGTVVHRLLASSRCLVSRLRANEAAHARGRSIDASARVSENEHDGEHDGGAERGDGYAAARHAQRVRRGSRFPHEHAELSPTGQRPVAASRSKAIRA